MKNLTFSAIAVLIVFVTSSCSVERNTWASKAYHNTTAHFNGYWYANEEINKIEGTILKSQVDDYNRILRLYPTFDSTLASGYKKDADEAIKMASLAIQRHSNSKWVDDAYILVGKARLYTMDWTNAIQTFKHVNTKSKDKDARHLAIINLIRTYIEHQEFNNAKAGIDFLAKAKLNRVNEKKYNLEKAYYYQLLNDYNNMVMSLTNVDHLLKKRDRRGRIYFIIGQVYQELGFEAEAYNYYKKCISTNPEYEVDFYARLYMAQVTEISRGRDIHTARKSFRKLLKDSKNKEFRDKIFYEMGVFELKHKNLKESVASFNKSIREGTNKKIDGEAFLRLGEIYYDTLKDYELSQAYYDSAITSLPTDYENYSAIKQRADILNEFVKHLKTIQWQDSLLSLASLDSVSLMAKVEAVVTERVKEAEKKALRKKASNRGEAIGDNNASSLFGSMDGDNGEAVEWYFGNPSAMGIGQTEFLRVWGNIKLEDNWRRSQRQNARNANVVTEERDTEQQDEAGKAGAAAAADPVMVEFNQLNSEIPRTDEARKASLAKIEEAYFRLGDIYYFKLQENENAKQRYLQLLNRFPNSVFEPEALYALYLLTKDVAPDEAEKYASLLKTKHPQSTFAKILINPDYLQESSLAVEKQKVLYKTAYELFQNRHYDSASQVIIQATQLGETSFNPTLNLLSVLIIGETEDISKYQYALDEFIKANEQDPLAAYAKKLLDASRSYQQAEEKRKGIQYIRSFDEPHYFVMVYRTAERLDPSSTLEKFNEAQFKSLNLKTSNLILNEEYSITFVADLQDKTTAAEYFKTFSENRSKMGQLGNQKFHNFVITKDNFNIFYRTKGLDEYLQFFEKNYATQNQ